VDNSKSIAFGLFLCKIKAMKKLHRSKNNKVFAGIIGGIGEYFDIDPVLFRVVWILILVFTGFVPAIVAYFLMMLIVPRAV